MGVIPSQTSYYTLPFNAIRICHGGHDGRCFCNGGYHRKEKYVYVDRRSDGRERYHDVMDLMQKYMQGGFGGGAAGGGGGNMGGMGQGGAGGGMGWPFRDAREWTIRDYDRLGDVMKEYYDRERGRGRWAPGEQNGGGGMMGMPPQMGMGMYPGMMNAGMGMNPQMMGAGMMPPPPMTPQPGVEGFAGQRGAGAQHQHQYPSMEEFQRLQQDLEEKFREYNRHMGVLFGTEQDRQKDQYRATMLKTLQEIMPQLAQMMMQQQMMGGGRINPGMMGMPPQMAGMNPVAGQNVNPMAYGPPNPAMMGQVPPGPAAPMQSPYAQGGYNYDPMPPRRPYRRKRWQDRYEDDDAFCNEDQQRRTLWDSHPHHGRFGGRKDRDDDMLDGGAMPSRPRPSGPFGGPGPGGHEPFPHSRPPPRRNPFVPPNTMSMADTMPPTVPPLHASPHLGRGRMDTQPPFPSSRPGLARANTFGGGGIRHSHLDPDFDAGPSSANVRINLDPQMDAGAAAFDSAYGGGVGRPAMGAGFGRTTMGDELGPGPSSMRTGVGMQSGGYVPETSKLSEGRDVEDRRDEPDVGQGITDHTGR